MLKKILTISLFALALAGCSRANQPALVYKDTYGNPIRLHDYKGKWILINYWAPWCKPCRTEIEQLNAFFIAHHDKDAVVLGVNYDHLPAEQLPAIVTAMKISYPVLTSDPAKELGLADITALPVTFVINPQGKLVKTLWGEQTRSSLESVIENTAVTD